MKTGIIAVSLMLLCTVLGVEAQIAPNTVTTTGESLLNSGSSLSTSNTVQFGTMPDGRNDAAQITIDTNGVLILSSVYRPAEWDPGSNVIRIGNSGISIALGADPNLSFLGTLSIGYTGTEHFASMAGPVINSTSDMGIHAGWLRFHAATQITLDAGGLWEITGGELYIPGDGLPYTYGAVHMGTTDTTLRYPMGGLSVSDSAHPSLTGNWKLGTYHTYHGSDAQGGATKTVVLEDSLLTTNAIAVVVFGEDIGELAQIYVTAVTSNSFSYAVRTAAGVSTNAYRVNWSFAQAHEGW